MSCANSKSSSGAPAEVFRNAAIGHSPTAGQPGQADMIISKSGFLDLVLDFRARSSSGKTDALS